MTSKRTSTTARAPRKTGSGRSHGHGVSLGLASLLLIAANLAVYAQAARFEFLNFDDDVYVTANPPVRAGLTLDSVRWAFTTTHESNWHPLTWLSLMLDAQVGGADPRVFHVTNVILHIANTCLLLVLLWTSTALVWRSAFVAALFAVHPLHVESVAWVAERKDVLSTLLWLLTMIAYTRYCQKPAAWRYFLAIAAFALGLMAKPMLVTLPLVLLLWDRWPLARSAPRIARGSASDGARSTDRRRVLREKIPFFALSAVSCVVTLFAQNQGGAMGSVTRYPLDVRLANAAVSYVIYISKTILPHRLAIFYPHPLHSPPAWMVLSSVAILAGVTATVLGPLRRWHYLSVGWLWYLVTLVPVIGFVQVGGQAMADRYTYVPLIGLFLMVAWGVPDLAALLWKSRARRASSEGARALSSPGTAPSSLPGAAPSSLNGATTVASSPGAAQTFPEVATIMASSTGPAQTSSGNTRPASSQGVTRARASGKPEAGKPETGKREIGKREIGKPANSLTQARGRSAVLVTSPIERWMRLALTVAGTIVVLLFLSRARLQTRYWHDSVSIFEHALAVTDRNFVAHCNLGVALFNRGELDPAVAHLQEALRIDPLYPDAHNNLAGALLKQGKIEEAMVHCRQVLDQWPDHPRAHTNLGIAYMLRGNLAEASRHLLDALRLDPDFIDARLNLGVVLAGQGKLDEAIVQFREVLRLDPNDEDARRSLDQALETRRKRGGSEPGRT